MNADDWAARKLRELVPDDTIVPIYGSAPWHALPEDSPLRIAAAIAAAAGHAADADDLTERLAELLDDEREQRRVDLFDLVGPVATLAARRPVQRGATTPRGGRRRAPRLAG